MKIIPKCDDPMKLIAMEAVNIMAGKRLFDIKNVKYDPLEDPGYPRVRINNVDYYFRAAYGFIFLPSKIDRNQIKEFEHAFINAIGRINAVLKNTKHKNYLDTYHTVENYPYTSIRILSGLKLMKTSEYFGANNLKIETRTVDKYCLRGKKRTARFTWYVFNINDIDLSIYSSNIDDALAINICSIFYDADGIMLDPSVDNLLQFKMSCVKGYDKFTGIKLFITSIYSNIFVFEINKYWKTRVPIKLNFIKNLSRHKIYLGDYDLLKVKDDRCERCKEKLCGENYMLTNGPNKSQKVFCPLCLHTHDMGIVKNYLFIFRIQFPRSIKQAIEESEISPAKKEIMKYIIDNKIEYFKDPKIGRYILFGDDYIGVENLQAYLFGGLYEKNSRRILRIVSPIT